MAVSIARLPLPVASPGTRREIMVRRYGKPGARPKVHMQAALHADEWPGLMALNHLSHLLDEADIDGRISGEIVIVPVANPIGLAQGINDYIVGRYALMDGGHNFNRFWPDLTDAVADRVGGGLGGNEAANVAAVRAALSEAVAELPAETELQALRKVLLSQSIDADYVLDVHCDTESTAHMYGLAVHEAELAALAADMACPVLLLERDAGGDPFDTANSAVWVKLAERFPKAAIPAACVATTLELRGRADVSDELGAKDAAGLFRFLQRQGAVAGDPGPLPEPAGEPTPLEGVDVILSPGAGLVAYRADLGAWVEKGAVVADLIDLMADDPKQARTPLVSRTSGILFARQVDRLVRPGQTVVKVAGHAALEHRKQGQLLENR